MATSVSVHDSRHNSAPKTHALSLTNNRNMDSLTPIELAEPKMDPKVNIFVWPIDDHYIGIENAFENVLTHFSGFAKKELVDRHAKSLVLPDVPKHIATFIYRQMLMGDKGVHGPSLKLENLRVPELLALYSHCKNIEYESLMVQAIHCLRFRLQTVLLDVNQLSIIFK
ncbi:hypothetical protein GQ43DRAFT_312616 [Delitschia confertaspora ATCC 74209]|uniref:Uncharacterized protein n=1 Tax=Delitschia confertaspora ATCC 74209 TaxID=1513339 RepID=A0A9P4JNL9_9PLEO|nr:hypothetical protein GQ43DRAFT_312616 [Delitschia confertaspora ATCC 74209]